MKKSMLSRVVIFLLIFGLGSCVTINIYFPAAAVEKAADRIVDEVWGGDKPAAPEKGSGPQSFINQLLKFAFTVISPADALAQEADINVTTPAIRALKESIKERAGALQAYLDKGNVGIANNGLLAVRSVDDAGLKDKALIKRLVDAENADRNNLYIEIAKANKFPPEKVKEIGEIFAKSWINQAKKGWWIQDSSGKWSMKE
jgi:uncharacterized protein YdbL (DUF1318 family)